MIIVFILVFLARVFGLFQGRTIFTPSGDIPQELTLEIVILCLIKPGYQN
ncbi:MAG: hypothetical protein ACL9RN_04150 [Cylindrospermopsis raciborskii]|nr:hypothetical protein [Cylindrospermopsis raciborskii]